MSVRAGRSPRPSRPPHDPLRPPSAAARVGGRSPSRGAPAEDVSCARHASRGLSGGPAPAPWCIAACARDGPQAHRARRADRAPSTSSVRRRHPRPPRGPQGTSSRRRGMLNSSPPRPRDGEADLGQDHRPSYLGTVVEEGPAPRRLRRSAAPLHAGGSSRAVPPPGPAGEARAHSARGRGAEPNPPAARLPSSRARCPRVGWSTCRRRRFLGPHRDRRAPPAPPAIRIPRRREQALPPEPPPCTPEGPRARASSRPALPEPPQPHSRSARAPLKNPRLDARPRRPLLVKDHLFTDAHVAYYVARRRRAASRRSPWRRWPSTRRRSPYKWQGPFAFGRAHGSAVLAESPAPCRRRAPLLLMQPWHRGRRTNSVANGLPCGPPRRSRAPSTARSPTC